VPFEGTILCSSCLVVRTKKVRPVEPEGLGGRVRAVGGLIVLATVGLALGAAYLVVTELRRWWG
jgi:hypothetical protein